MGVKHGLPMTHNVLEDGSFRKDLPFFGGAIIFDHKGKEKDANKRVIDKLVETGALIARGRLKHQLPTFVAVEGAADLPQHAAVVCRHRQTAGRRNGRIR